MITYVDDKAVVAYSQKGLQESMNRLNTVTKEYSMNMCISRKGKSEVHLLIYNQQVEQVSQLDIKCYICY